MDKLGCGCGTHKNIIKVTSKSYLEYASKLRHVVRLRIRDMTYLSLIYIYIYIYICSFLRKNNSHIQQRFKSK